MKSTLESTVEEKACELIYNNLGVENSKLKILGDSGYPDRVFWLPGGRPFFIEFKRPGEEPRPKQYHVHNQLRQLGYSVEVHDDPVNAFKAIIKALEATCVSEEGRKILARAKSKARFLK